MYFKKYFFIVCAVLFTLLFSCKKESEKADPLLLGNWSDGNSKYTFSQNLTFGIKYLRSGTATDSVLTDSIWGKYSVDTKRSNIYFEATQLTEKKQPSKVVTRKISLPVWNYSFTTDSILNYSSSSLKGQLRKIKK